MIATAASCWKLTKAASFRICNKYQKKPNGLWHVYKRNQFAYTFGVKKKNKKNPSRTTSVADTIVMVTSLVICYIDAVWGLWEGIQSIH